MQVWIEVLSNETLCIRFFGAELRNQSNKDRATIMCKCKHFINNFIFWATFNCPLFYNQFQMNHPNFQFLPMDPIEY